MRAEIRSFLGGDAKEWTDWYVDKFVQLMSQQGENLSRPEAKKRTEALLERNRALYRSSQESADREIGERLSSFRS